MWFNLEDHEHRVKDYKKVWKAVKDQLFITFTSPPVKEGCYLHAEVKQWKDRIKTDFHDKDIPYNQSCEATAYLRITGFSRMK